MSNQIYPVRGSLAWAAIQSFSEVDVWDSFNGVPSLGIMWAGSEATLFWRALGYVSDVSVWVYLPLTMEEVARIEDDDSDSPLEGLLFQAPNGRVACAGVARGNRLRFEREWMVPAGKTSEEIMRDVIIFVAESLGIAVENQLPATRSEMTSLRDAVKRLVPC